jgi:hypothetical protein
MEQQPAVVDEPKDGEVNSLKVKVALRIRPLIKRDLIEDYQIAITPDLNTNSVGTI